MRSKAIMLTVSAMVLATTAGLLVAGPLNPPAGPVASTYKTLSEVEPRIPIGPETTPSGNSALYRITRSGSYYLTGNINVGSGWSGIRIDASGVTIDLNGYTISGLGNSNAGVISGANSRVEVRNGTINGITGHGVDFFNVRGGVVRDLNVEGCGTGIRLGESSIAEGCIARGNTAIGFESGQISVLRRCSALSNATGFDVNGGVRIEDCLAAHNTGAGILTTDSSTIVRTSAFGNDGTGIQVPWGCEVSDCNVTSNGGHGIQFGSYCKILRNNARGNDSAGLYGAANGSRTVVRDNNISESAVGIKLDGAMNLVFGNTLTSNTTNIQTVANNRVATIVNLGLSPAITGSSGGTAVSTPDANYVY